MEKLGEYRVPPGLTPLFPVPPLLACLLAGDPGKVVRDTEEGSLPPQPHPLQYQHFSLKPEDGRDLTLTFRRRGSEGPRVHAVLTTFEPVEIQLLFRSLAFLENSKIPTFSSLLLTEWQTALGREAGEHK